MSYAGAARTPGSRAARAGQAVPTTAPAQMAAARSRPRDTLALCVLPTRGRLALRQSQRSCSPGTVLRPGGALHQQKLQCAAAADIRCWQDQSHTRFLAEPLPVVVRPPRTTHAGCVLVS